MGMTVGSQLPSSIETMSLTDQQCKALVALKWAPLRCKQALHTLRMTRATFGAAGAVPLADLLRAPDELKALKVSKSCSIFDSDLFECVIANWSPRSHVPICIDYHPFVSTRSSILVCPLQSQSRSPS